MKKSNNNQIPFEEKELDLLRNAVDKAEHKVGRKFTQSNDINNIIKILEDFLRKKKTSLLWGNSY